LIEKENWLVIKKEGLRDFQNNVYYKSDVPEKHIVHQMQEVMTTANLYFNEKNEYPSKIKQISETSFQYHNPFINEMSIPSIQTVRLNDQPPEVVADFIWMVRKGGTWPGELPLAPGVIHGCRVSYTDRDVTKQQFLMHCCDRDGAIITATDSPALVLQSDSGKNVDTKLSLPVPQRTPTLWLVKIPPDILPKIIPLLKYRFAAIYGAVFVVFLLFYLVTPDNRSRAGAAVLLIGSLLACIATLLSINI